MIEIEADRVCMPRSYYEALEASVNNLQSALTELVRCFPTDDDLDRAGWDIADINEACDAYDKARKSLESL